MSYHYLAVNLIQLTVAGLALLLGLLILYKVIRSALDTKRADERWKQFNERYEYRDGKWVRKRNGG